MQNKTLDTESKNFAYIKFTRIIFLVQLYFSKIFSELDVEY